MSITSVKALAEEAESGGPTKGSGLVEL